jgi:magnesium transporter
MLNIYPKDASATPVWVDLADPNPEERDEVRRLLGVEAPSREALSEIESSSRLRAGRDSLTMSIPMIARAADGEAEVAPVGFVLSPGHLVTVRFRSLRAFEVVAERFADPAHVPASGPEVFVVLCEEMVDRLADLLEGAAADLRGVSVQVFHLPSGEGRTAIRSSRFIRGRLRHLGRLGDHVSEVRDVLLGVGRAADFACELTAGWGHPELEPRLRTLRQDVASLDDYQVHLSDKVQFLLDAMVGLIGIAQNDVFKVLTIVSIVGIPPTLVAGIYGMNFKGMPEYNWAWGYPYGLAVIALTAIIPLLWFKWRGWF